MARHDDDDELKSWIMWACLFDDGTQNTTIQCQEHRVELTPKLLNDIYKQSIKRLANQGWSVPQSESHDVPSL